MNPLQLLQYLAAIAAAYDYLPDHAKVSGGVCKLRTLLPEFPSGPMCRKDSTLFKEELDEPRHYNTTNYAWPLSTPCARSGTEEYCTYSDPDFANGHGITVLTTAPRAARLAQSRVFTDSSFLSPVGAVNTPSSPKWSVLHIPGKDLGLVASQRLEPGDHIMSNTPSLMIDYGIYEALGAEEIRYLQLEGVEHLPPRHRAGFMNLSTHDDPGIKTREDRVDKITLTNAFDIYKAGEAEEEDEEEARTWFTVFGQISRMNHDCRPNADYYFDPVTLTHHIHAIAPIAPGEEITISYIDNVQPLSARQSRIQGTWHFTCSCRQCTQSTAQSRASDSRIAQLISVRSRLRSSSYPSFYPPYSSSSSSSSSSTSPEMAQLLISLTSQERLWGAPMAEAHALAALERSGAGDAWSAIQEARCAEQWLLDAGRAADEREVRDMWELAGNPWAHWSWMGKAGGWEREGGEGDGEEMG
ncbi:hypothetical protein F5X99DRAFT_413649 [Biscogniauxia marginata]|nr:hypothetical protein F5X99DRAFT_413649 [Biscogniauxia marginata]